MQPLEWWTSVCATFLHCVWPSHLNFFNILSIKAYPLANSIRQQNELGALSTRLRVNFFIHEEPRNKKNLPVSFPFCILCHVNNYLDTTFPSRNVQTVLTNLLLISNSSLQVTLCIWGEVFDPRNNTGSGWKGWRAWRFWVPKLLMLHPGCSRKRVHWGPDLSYSAIFSSLFIFSPLLKCIFSELLVLDSGWGPWP